MPGPTAKRPRLAVRALHLATLWTFAVAYPFYDVANVETFLGVAPREIVLFALGLSLGVPLALAFAEWVVAAGSRRAGWMLHVGLVGLLSAMFVSQVLGHAPSIPDGIRLVVAVLGGVGFAAAYARDRPAGIVLTVLSPAVVIVLALFLLASEPSRLGEDPRGAASPASGRVPVVMIVFDELPAISLMDASGDVDPVRYPNFAALRRESTWFPNATTIHDSTHSAIPALLTGRRADRGNLPIAADFPRSVFTLLADRRRFDVIEPATALCPASLCPPTRPFGQRMGTLIEEAARLSANQLLPPRTAARLFPPLSDYLDAPAQTRRFLSRLPDPREPSLSLLHMLIPHQPWRYLPSGRRYRDEAESEGLFRALVGLGRWSNDPAPAHHAFQRHLLQLVYADRLLGQVMRRLRARGLYDRALVVVAADHGVSFRPGAAPRLGMRENVEDVLSVPLFVKRPGQRRGTVSARFVRTIDVVPTVAAAAGARAGGPFDGQPVFAPGFRDPRTVGVTSRTGRGVSLPAAEFERRRLRAARRQAALFGTGRARGIYWIGPERDLLGRPLAGLRLAPRPAGRARLSNAGALASVDGDAETLPARLTGTLSGPGIRRGARLGVALNGRLVAATEAYGPPGDVRFATMVPEGSLREGRNDVRLILIERRRGRRTLAPITTQPRDD